MKSRPSCSGEEHFFDNVFLFFRNYLRFVMYVALHMNKLISLLPKNALCQVQLKLFQPSRIFVKVFSLFLYYLPLEKGRALHLRKTISPHHPTIVCAKFGSNWPNGSWEKDFLNFIDSFSSPFGNKRVLHFNKLHSLHLLSQRRLCAKFSLNRFSRSVEDENVKSLRQRCTIIGNAGIENWNGFFVVGLTRLYLYMAYLKNKYSVNKNC